MSFWCLSRAWRYLSMHYPPQQVWIVFTNIRPRLFILSPDVIIAASLCFLLQRSRTGFKQWVAECSMFLCRRTSALLILSAPILWSTSLYVSSHYSLFSIDYKLKLSDPIRSCSVLILVCEYGYIWALSMVLTTLFSLKGNKVRPVFPGRILSPSTIFFFVSLCAVASLISVRRFHLAFSLSADIGIAHCISGHFIICSLLFLHRETWVFPADVVMNCSHSCCSSFSVFKLASCHPECEEAHS